MFKRSAQLAQLGLVAPSALVVIIIVVVLLLVGKTINDRAHVLGQSLIAEGPPPSSGSQPQQQSQPQNQPPQNSTGANKPPQSPPNQPNLNPPNTQGNYPPGQPVNNNPNNPKIGNQPGVSGNLQPNPSAGTPPQKPGPNTLNPEQMQVLQQKFQQQAQQQGFQLNGSLPPQYLQSQQNSSGNGQPSGSNQPNTRPVGPNFQALPPPGAFPSIQGNFNVSVGGKDFNLNDGNTKVQLGGNTARAVRPDGTRVEIDKASQEKIATAIKLETGSDVSQNGDNFTIKRGSVGADTKLPISFNVATKTFTVQTANGTSQEVKVLPDEAVQKLIENKVISAVDAKNTTLTEVNNQPVYQVSGSSSQKFLGFLPVSIAKTTLVSAQTGDKISETESPLSRILDAVSF